jgi:hypothetical protein
MALLIQHGSKRHGIQRDCLCHCGWLAGEFTNDMAVLFMRNYKGLKKTKLKTCICHAILL